MATISFSTTGATQVELPLRQFDAEAYMTMTAAGVFEGQRVELIGGYVVEMSPANPDHNYVIMRLNELFVPLMGQFKIWIQGTLAVDRRHVLDPDFMLLHPREQSYRDALPTPVDIALVVEVAGSLLARDVGIKLPLYAKHCVPEYWIVDLDRETIVIHRSPGLGKYEDVCELQGEQTIATLAAPTFSVKVGDVFL